jgi:hypothetical protein
VIRAGVGDVQAVRAGGDIVEEAEREAREVHRGERCARPAVEAAHRIDVDDPERVANDRHASW